MHGVALGGAHSFHLDRFNPRLNGIFADLELSKCQFLIPQSSDNIVQKDWKEGHPDQPFPQSWVQDPLLRRRSGTLPPTEGCHQGPAPKAPGKFSSLIKVKVAIGWHLFVLPDPPPGGSD